MTERLIIRRFTKNDSHDLYEYLSDEKVVTYEPYGVFSEEDCQREAVRRSNDSSFWAVCLKNTGKLIGNVYLGKRDFDAMELGYVFNQAYWGKGYAAEAAAAVVDYAFKECNARRVSAMCNPKNTASWKLLESLGMRREGHLIQNIYFKTDENGQPEWSDTYEYGILASEWENRKVKKS